MLHRRQLSSSPPDRVLERQSGRLGMSGSRFLFLGVLLAVPGVLLMIFGQAWVFALGIVLIAVASWPIVVATGLLLSALVARWAGHHKPFA